jgi:hypothetical protein
MESDTQDSLFYSNGSPGESVPVNWSIMLALPGRNPDKVSA